MELQINKLSKTYGKTKALEDYCYAFTEGVYGILGPNGAGKSTLMSLITDNIKRETGDILFDGREDEGRARHYAILPALQLEGMLGMKYAKEVMIRRGVFKNTVMRRAARELSRDDMREIDKIFEIVGPYMKKITV